MEKNETITISISDVFSKFKPIEERTHSNIKNGIRENTTTRIRETKA